MNNRAYFSFLLILFFMLSACNSTDNKAQIVSKCTILGDEAKQYGRANYLRLFYHINPKKFESTFQKVATFDNKSHRSMINTYLNALNRIKTNDKLAQQLITSTQKIAHFVQNFVDHDYAKAIEHKDKSEHKPESDNFFMEINDIVKFDHTSKGFDENKASFKELLEKHNKALTAYTDKKQ